MLRAVQTGRPLADLLAITPEAIDDLKESDHLRSSYTPAEEMDADHEVLRAFLDDPMSMFSDGYEAFRDRVRSAFDSIVERNRGGTVAVFCHATVTGVYLQALLGHDDPFAVMTDYCGIMRVTASSTGIRTVRSVNETGHLRHLD
jgi:broad specificity phosphatase PhoE